MKKMNLVFDLGGVVVRWDPAAIVAAVFDDPHEQALVLDGLFAHPDWVELDRGSLSPEEASKRAASRTGLDAARLLTLLDGMPQTMQPIPASLTLLRDLRTAGHRLFVLSNQHRSSLAYLQATFDFFALFEGRVVSCEVGCCKPEAAIYRRLLEDFALEPGATVFIDDMQGNLDAAALEGMRTIRFTDAASCRAQLQVLGCA